MRKVCHNIANTSNLHYHLSDHHSAQLPNSPLFLKKRMFIKKNYEPLTSNPISYFDDF